MDGGAGNIGNVSKWVRLVVYFYCGGDMVLLVTIHGGGGCGGGLVALRVAYDN